MTEGNTGPRDGLAERAEAAAAPTSAPTMAMVIHEHQAQIQRALPTHLKDSVEAFERAAITLVRTTPGLRKCDQASVLGGLMLASQLGLQLGGPLGHAYLVPFKGKAQFILGYKGTIDLAWRSNRLRSIEARTVYLNDDFDFSYGLNPVLTHVPEMEGDRGLARCYYGVAHFKDGGHYFVVVPKSEIEDHRKRSASANASSSPWKSDYDAMARKTVINIMRPYLPLTTEVMRDLTQDGMVATGTSVDDLETEDVDYGADEDVVDGELVEE